MAEKCGYCGRFMKLIDYGAEYGTEWVCSRQDYHVAADPEHWSIGSLDSAVRVAKIRAGLDPYELSLPATFIDFLDKEWRLPFWERQVERILAEDHD